MAVRAACPAAAVVALAVRDANLEEVVASLPDAHATIKDIFGQGDQVVVRVVVRGTQKGALLGIPATGRSIHWDGVDIYRLRGGKISSIWAGDDWTAILFYTGTYKAPWIP